ncbi:hypothetical protein ACFQ3P_20695 [Paraburkholderia sabiae]|uniref:Uncharacterized protein n=1 Tax=Paraburkholderia sabiae TaxID=273251 RepID=A0ABU9QJS3_9BURK|nr:hypothetical protein [Paraburkholderia sabiae]WJZ73485.1 hypothetical protein QEN71_25640 [Paraburkholderia sabiae]CAD6542189.1 hypothetical protein LMG24235_03757 [Paraburkholderia sabiae]
MKSAGQWLSFQNADGSHRLMTCFVLVLGLFNFFFGEIVPAGGGFGWDGVTYADMVRNLGSLISDGKLSHYYAQRILPSAVVRTMLLMWRAPFTNINIIHAFSIYNLTLLLCATIAWKRIANHLSLSVTGRWLGFSGIFVNFIVSKQVMYYPVSTDVTAVLISLLLLLFYLKRSPIPLFTITVVGSFVWQITSIYGAMLMLSLCMTMNDESANPPRSTFNSKKFFFVFKASFLVILALSITAYCIIAFVLRFAPQNSERVHVFERFFAGAPSLLAVIVAMLMVLGSLQNLSAIVAQRRTVKIHLWILAAAGLLIPACIVRLISNPALPDPNGFLQVLEWAVFPLNGEGKFLLPLLTLTLTWGPAILLSVIYWPDVCVEVRKLGPGVMGVVAMTLPLGLVTEPRYVLGAWPFVVVALVLVLAKSKLSRPFTIAFFALAILYAQFWLKLNLAPWTGGDGDGLLDFPKQMLFMHYGPWMSWPSYLIQLPIVVLSGILLRRLLRSSNE